MSIRKSFKLPKTIEKDLSQRVIKDGYGMRGRSRWICDAIQNFLLLDDEEFIIDCVEYAEQISGLDTTITYRSSNSIENLVGTWIKRIRLKNPLMEGVRSNIYRASILQQLLGSIETISHFAKSEALVTKNAIG